MRFVRSLPAVSAVLALALAPSIAPAQQQQQQPLPPGYAGSATCTQCHKKEVAEFTATTKGSLLMAHPRNTHEKLGCESCHGAAKQHGNSGGEERGALVTFGGKLPSPVATRNAVCLNCHEKTARTLWKGSAHEARNVACTDCHTVMHNESERGNLKKATVLEACGSCHAQRKAQAMRFSHMPVGEGKMECTSCHSPHGSANEKLLIASSVNETCFSCHTEKRGPFLWEHAPVVENCANCHDSHGSNKEKMLKGLDSIGETLQATDAIDAYERRQTLAQPWLEIAHADPAAPAR